MQDIKQIKQEDKIKIVKKESKKERAKPPCGVYRMHKKVSDQRQITAETKAASVLSIAGPDQTIDELNSAIRTSPGRRSQDGDDSSDFFDGSVDEDMEFEDEQRSCAAAIGQIPLSASLHRERSNQGSFSKSIVSDGSILLADSEESPAGMRPDENDDADAENDVMVAVSVKDMLKDQNLHDIVELKAQSVIYRVDFVKTLEKNGVESESEQIEFQQLSSSENKTSQRSKDDSIKQVLDGCEGVRLSVMKQEEFAKAVCAPREGELAAEDGTEKELEDEECDGPDSSVAGQGDVTVSEA